MICQRIISYRYAYQGQEKDPETNLTSFELRMYDPRLGRWHAPDPYGEMPTPYSSMANNPISLTDPDGGYLGVNDPYNMLSYGGGTTDGNYGKQADDMFAVGSYFWRHRDASMDAERHQGQIDAALSKMTYEQKRYVDYNSDYKFEGGAIRYEWERTDNVSLTRLLSDINTAFAGGGISTYTAPNGWDNFYSVAKPTLNFFEAINPVSNLWDFGTYLMNGTNKYGETKSGLDAGYYAAGSLPFVALEEQLYLQGSKVLSTGVKPVVQQTTNQGIKSLGAAAKGFAGRTINQLNKLIQKGQLPSTFKRFDKGKIFGELDHVHFTDGSALNINGTWKHGGRALSNSEIKVLQENGWTLPH